MRLLWIGVLVLVLVGCGGKLKAPYLSDLGSDAVDAGDGIDLLVSDVGDVKVAVPPADPCEDSDPVAGGFCAPCEEDADCDSGYCVWSANGNVCTVECEYNCPLGWSCDAIAGEWPNFVSICVPGFVFLCNPCQWNEDCNYPELPDTNICLSHGGAGNFCAEPCDSLKPCPQGYVCAEYEVGISGDTPVLMSLCVPGEGDCTCSKSAVAEGLSTKCFKDNEAGKCTGVRTCTENGLTYCDALKPEFEVCDGADNDCDGGIDEELGMITCGRAHCIHDVPACENGEPGDCDPFEGAIQETCNGFDEDCDGVIDNLGTTTCGFGVCSVTVDNCFDGMLQTCVPSDNSSPEVCDGLDNDCDGAVDQGLGTATCGVGLCAHTQETCIDGAMVECDEYAGATDEICDKLDNDCDGAVDEDLGSTDCGVGFCFHSQANCVNGIVTECDPMLGAMAEICDGLDNDCDGQVDEDFGPVSCGVGPCEHTIESCVGGVPFACDPLEGSGPEKCNGVDDDCDGSVDEELGSTTCGEGVCQTTVQNCVEGGSQSCVPLDLAGTEVCDSLDNDCDGQLNEGLGSTTCGLGVCLHTVENCLGGVVQVCDAMQSASAEVCDGLDNDCDGEIDENLGNTTCGQGKCNNTIANCVAGVPQVCDPMLGSSPEECNLLDDDCDGQADEGLGSTSCGVGACAHSVPNCHQGVQQECDPMEGASSEGCNGIDDDCDGLVDEGFGSTECGLGKCKHVQPNCENGSPSPCDPMAGATAEQCNSVDDDCDGLVDENLGVTECGLGKCKHEQINCVGGVPQICNPMQGAEAELCNSVDDDCDGQVDEELGTTECGLGKCKHTQSNCVNGVPTPCDPMQGTANEVCNAQDDDCDGVVDEDLGSTTCGQGECVHTQPNCISGVPQICNPYSGAAQEVCNLKDDDCDGQVDDGMDDLVCGDPPNQYTLPACIAGIPQSCP